MGALVETAGKEINKSKRVMWCIDQAHWQRERKYKRTSDLKTRVLTAFFLQQYSFHMPRSPERRRHRDRSHSIDRHKDDYRKDRHRK